MACNSSGSLLHARIQVFLILILGCGLHHTCLLFLQLLIILLLFIPDCGSDTNRDKELQFIPDAVSNATLSFNLFLSVTNVLLG